MPLLPNTYISDFDPNSIIQASKKVQTIGTSKMRNISENPQMADFNLTQNSKIVKEKASEYISLIDSILSETDKIRSLLTQRINGRGMMGGMKKSSTKEKKPMTVDDVNDLMELINPAVITMFSKYRGRINSSSFNPIRKILENEGLEKTDVDWMINFLKGRLREQMLIGDKLSYFGSEHGNVGITDKMLEKERLVKKMLAEKLKKRHFDKYFTEVENKQYFKGQNSQSGRPKRIESGVSTSKPNRKHATFETIIPLQNQPMRVQSNLKSRDDQEDYNDLVSRQQASVFRQPDLEYLHQSNRGLNTTMASEDYHDARETNSEYSYDSDFEDIDDESRISYDFDFDSESDGSDDEEQERQPPNNNNFYNTQTNNDYRNFQINNDNRVLNSGNEILNALINLTNMIQKTNLFFNTHIRKQINLLDQISVQNIKTNTDELDNVLHSLFNNGSIQFFRNNVDNADDIIKIIFLKFDELNTSVIIATKSYAPNNSQMGAIRGSGLYKSSFSNCSQKRFL